MQAVESARTPWVGPSPSTLDFKRPPKAFGAELTLAHPHLAASERALSLQEGPHLASLPVVGPVTWSPSGTPSQHFEKAEFSGEFELQESNGRLVVALLSR